MNSSHVVITLDSSVDAAYVQLLERPVAETVELTDAVMLDLDEHRVVVGIEMLSISAPLPYDELVSKYHVHSEVVHVLRTVVMGAGSGPTAKSFGLSARSQTAGTLRIGHGGLIDAQA